MNMLPSLERPKYVEMTVNLYLNILGTLTVANKWRFILSLSLTHAIIWYFDIPLSIRLRPR
jgi:hypothetical protein